MAVYGDMLSFFSELKRPVIFFTMKPNTVAGYANRIGERKIYVIYMPMKIKDLDYEGGSLSSKTVPTVWTEKKLDTNTFARIDEVDYRCVNAGRNYGFEGNFNVYVLENIIGNTDKQVKNPSVDLGRSDYA